MTGGKYADQTRDELIDELVKSEERENGLVEEVARVNQALRDSENRLEQSEDRDVLSNLTAALEKAGRLWKGINDWYEKHKRGCQYAMQPGGFCAECIWVKHLIDAEKDLEPGISPTERAEEAEKETTA